MAKSPKMLNERKEGGIGLVICAVLLLVILLILSFEVYLRVNYFVVEVSGDSMLETVHSGDYLYAKIDREPQHGDVVIIDTKDDEVFSGDYIIKRVIGLEGDTVKCEANVVYVKYAGEDEYVPLDEPYAYGNTWDFSAVLVGEGEIFFLGDNRENSRDARISGCRQQSAVTGVVPEWSISTKGFFTFWEGLRIKINSWMN